MKPDPTLEYSETEDDILMILGLQVSDLTHCLDAVFEVARRHYDLPEGYEDELEKVLSEHHECGPEVVENGVAVIHARMETPGPDLTVLVRLHDAIRLIDAERHPTKFVWVLLSNAETHPHVDKAAEFANLMADRTFAAQVVDCGNAVDLQAIYENAVYKQIHFELNIPDELQRTGRWFGAFRDDIARRRPHYGADFTDGLNAKSLASVLFMFFACLAPSVAFGGLLSVLTHGEIGVVETILATGVCGSIYALTSGQPLTLLGSTGPIAIFLGILYSLTVSLSLPFLPTLAWVGLWTSLFMFLIVAVDGCGLIRFFTRFTDDTFAALISCIFIYQALSDMGGVFNGGVSYDTALLSLILSIGTYLVATNLSQFRKSPYLRRPVREFLADFGPAIAIVAMTGVAFALHEVDLETLGVPKTFGTTSGRLWLVDLTAAPTWVWSASAVPAALVAILVYLDQNITVRLVNSPDNKLVKGAGYHLDMLIIAALIAACSLFGLPWHVAATVRSLNHVRSLANVETVASRDGDGRDVVSSVVETRITGFTVHFLIACSLLLLPALRQIPMSVLFGLFLFMGVASMTGNQLFERLRLWVMDPTLYPPTYYLRAVPTKVVHTYTLIQFVCLAVLWTVKASPFGILFPLFIAVLVPVRMSMDKFFKAEHLALLDAEEAPEEEAFRLTD